MFRKVTRCVWATLAIVAVSVQVAVSDESDGPLLYRRIFVPADDMRQWPRDDETYLPIDAHKLADLIEHANHAGGQAATHQCRIRRATYQARLGKGQKLVGWAELDVEQGSVTPDFLPLEEITISIRDARWEADPSEPANIGSWGFRTGWPPQFGVLVPRSDRLSFRWEAYPRQTRGEELTFAIRLPHGLSNELILELPHGQQPRVHGGVVVPWDPSSGSDSTEDAPRADGTRDEQDEFSNPNEPVRRWSIAVPGKRTITLRIGSSSDDAQHDSLAGVHGRHTYEFTNRGVDITTVLFMEPAEQPVHELSFDLDPRLSLLSAEEDGGSLAWRIVPGNSTKHPLAIVTLPASSSADDRTIVLHAWTPLEIDRPWQLPVLRARELSWLSGEYALRIPAQLELRDLLPTGCIQTGVAPPTDGRDDTQYMFTQHEPAGSVQIEVGRYEPHVAARLGTTVTMSAAEITAQTLLDLRLNDGEKYAVTSTINSNWSVQSVESISEHGIGEWYVERHRGTNRLVVRLDDALRESRPLRLAIDGQLAVPGELDVVSIESLRMLAPARINVQKHLLGIRPAEGFVLRFGGDVRPVDVEDLTTEDRLLLTRPHPDHIVDLQRMVRPGSVRLSNGDVFTRAEINVDATIGDRGMKTTYQLRCQADNGSSGLLQIQFSEPLLGELQCVEAMSGKPLAARKVAKGQNETAASASGGEVWELPVQQTSEGEFTVEATVSVAASDRYRVPLAAVLGAMGQHGRVTIRANDRQRLSIDHHGIDPATSPIVPDRQDHHMTAAFRYDPHVLSMAQHDLSLAVSLDDESSATTPEYVRWLDVKSVLKEDGTAIHDIILQLVNQPGTTLALQLAGTATCESVLVDGTTVPGVANRAEPVDALEIPLAERDSVVAVRITNFWSPLKRRCSLPPPILPVHIPLLAGRWTAWLPEGFSADSTAGQLSSRHSAGQPPIETWIRDENQVLFDPFVTRTWAELWRDSGDRRQARSQAESFLAQLGQILDERPESITLWFDMITEAAGQVSGAFPVLADYRALAAQGIEPGGTAILPLESDHWVNDSLPTSVMVAPGAATPSANDQDDNDKQPGTGVAGEWLVSQGVAMVVHSRGLILTSQRVAALEAERLRPLPVPGLYEVSLDRTSDRGEETELRAAIGPLVPLSQWPTAPPFRHPAGVQHQADVKPVMGWRAFEFRFGPGRPAPLTLRNAATSRTWSVATLILSVVAGSVVGKKHPSWLLLPIGVAMATSLFLPQADAVLTLCLSLGLAGGALLALVRVQMNASGRERSTRIDLRRTSQSAILYFCGWLMLGQLPGPAAAQQELTPAPVVMPAGPLDEPSPSGAAPSTDFGARLHRILIPTDENRQPVGSKHYVSADLLRQLLQLSAPSGAVSGDWLIRRAFYSGELIPGPDGEQVAVGNWSADLDIQVNARDTPVHLPFRQEEAKWASTASLDGLPVKLNWSSNGLGSCCPVREPGLYRLKVSFVPNPVTADGYSHVKLTIPRTTNSQLTLSHPRALSGIEVLTPKARTTTTATSPSTRVELGSTNRLEVRWPIESKERTGATPGTTVLLWMRAGRDGVQFHVRPPMLLETRDFPRLGSFRLPALHFASMPIDKILLAVSCEPALQCEVSSENELPTSSTNEFLAKWGETSIRPQRVYEVRETLQSCRATIRPKETTATVEQSLLVTAGRQRFQLQYQADVLPGLRDRFHTFLEVPSTVTVEDILVTSAGESVPVQWAWADDGRVAVFFSQPLDDGYRMALMGHQRVPDDGKVLVPRVCMDRTAGEALRLFLYREENCRVQLDSLAEEPIGGTVAVPAPLRSTDRLVGSYVLQAGKVAQLKVEPNHVEAIGESMITITPDGRRWKATWSGRIHVKSGLLDKLDLDVPPNWNGPFEVEPSVPVDVQQASATRGFLAAGEQPDVGRSQRQPARNADTGEPNASIATVHLPRSVEPGDTIQLELRGPLQTTADGTLKVPNVRLRGIDLRTRFVAVPSVVDGRPANWQGVGVRVRDELMQMPQQLRPRGSLFATQAGQVFEVTADSYRLELQPLVESQSLAACPLVDVFVLEDSRRDQLVLTSFVIDAGGITDCELELPADHRLIDVSLGLAHANLVKTADRRWQFTLASTRLPQIARVVTHRLGGRPRKSSYVELSRPQLFAGSMRIQTSLTMWSIATPRGPLRPASVDATLLSPVECTLLRLERMLGPIDAATALSDVLPSTDALNWAQTWHSYLREARDLAAAAIAERALRAGEEQVSAEQPPAGQLSDQSKQIDEWFAATAAGDSIALDDRQPPWSQWYYLADRHSESSHLISDGDQNRLLLKTASAGLSARMSRFPYAVGILALSMAATFVLRRTGRGEFLWRWPYTIGVLVGIVWWAWLVPSALGLVIIVVCLLLQWRIKWASATKSLDATTAWSPRRDPTFTYGSK